MRISLGTIYGTVGQNTVKVWPHLCTNLRNAKNRESAASFSACQNTVLVWRHLCTNLSNATNKDLLPSLLVINTVLTIEPTWARSWTEIYFLLCWSEYSPGMASPLYQPEQCHEQRSTSFSAGHKYSSHHCTNLSNETNRDLLPALLVKIQSSPSYQTEIYFLLCWSEYSPAMASPLYQPEQCHEQRSAFFSHGQKPVQTWCQLCNYWSAFHLENLSFHKREILQFEKNEIFFNLGCA